MQHLPVKMNNLTTRVYRLLLVGLVAGLTACAAPGPGGSVAPTPKKEMPKVDPKIAAAYEAALDDMRAGKTARAEKALQQLSERYPNYSGPQTNLGILYFHQNKLDKAKAAFQAALAINPDNVVSLNHLGIISRSAGDFQQAKSYYEKALKVDPNYAYAHLNYGILLELYMGKLKEALAHYKRYQELTPKEDVEVKKWIVDLSRRVKK